MKTIEDFVGKFLCLLGFHKWKYDYEKIIAYKTNRCCERCNRWETACLLKGKDEDIIGWI